MSVIAVILTAGKSERFGSDKLMSPIGDSTFLKQVVNFFQSSDRIDSFVLVCSENNISYGRELCTGMSKCLSVVIGGATRAESAFIGVNALQTDPADVVLIHNGANPNVTDYDIDNILKALEEVDVTTVAQKMVDTVKLVDANSMVIETLDRKNLRRIQTPQGFRAGVLRKLYETHGVLDVTDELQLAEKSKLPIKVVDAHPLNSKLTYPSDLSKYSSVFTRIGVGEDSHAFDTNGTLVLGGYQVDGCPKLLANSDGDVVLHALTNALSSALGFGSLGIFADDMCKAGIIDSSQYLAEMVGKMHSMNFFVLNVSISLECGRPKIDPIAEHMKASIAALLSVTPQHVGITATSGEGLSAFGRGEGIRCTVNILLGLR
jgi:2-C-methyl-D-erythritol 4-phosphate cytidylyltransferase/2-C-methyl-D-erythritol 2,4-cyclodiphosphate synthase